MNATSDRAREAQAREARPSSAPALLEGWRRGRARARGGSPTLEQCTRGSFMQTGLPMRTHLGGPGGPREDDAGGGGADGEHGGSCESMFSQRTCAAGRRDLYPDGLPQVFTSAWYLCMASPCTPGLSRIWCGLPSLGLRSCLWKGGNLPPFRRFSPSSTPCGREEQRELGLSRSWASIG